MIELSAPQSVFINGLRTKNTAYVGGFGSGKTFVGCLKLLMYISMFPRTRWGFWAPSYPSIRDVFYPTFEEAAELMGFRVITNTSNKEVHVYRGRQYYGTVICRSMSDPASIVGYKVAGGICDELDTMKTAKANDAWNKVNARLRLKVPGLEQNWLGVTTTPEGFRFVYERFANNPKSRYSMVQASTYENRKYLPDDYIENLFETYPENLISAYLDGEFVNLTSGSVYPQYDRILNGSDEAYKSGETIYVGMDFNVGRMCAVIYVQRNGKPHAVDEIINAFDTPNMIELLKQKYWIELSQGEFKKINEIYVYPDSTGKNRKSVGASETDISLLKDAGFNVHAKTKNPPVKDRVNAMNAALCNSKGERTLKVNARLCPQYSQKLEQQVYNDRGEPDKDGTEDVNDAGGYYIAYEYPIIKPLWTGGFKMR